jgi:thiosulfate/3-mercaptopyruvate sulfurtransferase
MTGNPLPLPAPIVDLDWLLAHRDHPRLRLVDARSIVRAHAGTIPGARVLDTHLLQWKRSTPEAFANFVDAATIAIRSAGIESGDTVVAFEETSGAYAARAVWMLHALGHPTAALLDGGLHAWFEAGEPLDRPLPPTAPTAWSPAIDPATLIDGPDLRARLDDPAVAVLDTRSDQEWDAGTIPGAVHLEWTNLLDARGRFLPREVLAERFAAAGLALDGRTVVPFCGGGYRAAHAYVALLALGRSTRNYAPSWNEWGAEPEYPIAATRPD